MSKYVSLVQRGNYVIRITWDGDYVRTRKDGRPFFDINKCAKDLAKEMISNGCVLQSEIARCIDKDSYEMYTSVRAMGKEMDLP